MERPTFSVTVPAWNAQETLAATIESVLGQDFEGYELIIVDDGSSDDTLEIAEGYARTHDNIRVFSKSNGGTGSALNMGFSESRADLLVALGADDELVPKFLSTMTERIRQHPDYDIYGNDLLLVFHDGTEERFYGWNESHSITVEEMLTGTVIPGGGTVFRRKVFEVTKGYREEVKRVEDVDLWMRALAAGFRHIYFPDVLYLYQQGGPNRKSKSVIAEQEAKVRILTDFITSGRLDASQNELAQGGIARCEQVIELMQEEMRRHAVNERMHEQAESMHRTLSRLLPARLVIPTLRMLRYISWIVRPIRRLFLARAVDRSRRGGP